MIQFHTTFICQIWIGGRPYAQTRARHANGIVYSNASGALKRWKGLLGRELGFARQKMAFAAQHGALCVDMVFMMPIKNSQLWGSLCHTKPDIDNLQKAVLDVMENCGYFAVGDSQIAAGQVVKVWCRHGEEGVMVSFGKAHIKKAPASDSEGEGGDWLAASP